MLAVSAVVSVIVRRAFGYSFATWRLHLRGESIRSAQDVGWIRALTVDTNTVTVQATWTLSGPRGLHLVTLRCDGHTFQHPLLLGRRQRHNKRLQTALATSSLTDRLTGVYNYGTFVDHLSSEVRTAERYGGELSLIMLDLDHFKRFNDAHGHQAGNALLRELGATLRGLLRGADIVARYGGEEFVVLVRGGELDGLRLAERIRRAVLLLRVPVQDGEAYVTVSCGVASYPSDARDATRLIEYADTALYASKQGGRNCVCGHALGKVEDRAARKGSLRAVGS